MLSASSHTRVSEPSRLRRMSAKKGLSTDESERVRAELERIAEGRLQRDVARELGISQQTLSRVLLGEPVGYPTARALVLTYDLSFDVTVLGRPAPEQLPRLGDLPGYRESEREARQRYSYLPEQAWRAVANIRTTEMPRHISAEWLASLVSDWARGLTD